MEALQTATVTGILSAAPALILAPHPDDESLGCGGLIAAATEAGIPIQIVVVTNGAGARHAPPDAAALIRCRRAETVEAAAILGVPEPHLHFWSIPDGAADRRGPARRQFGGRAAALVREAKARTILVSWEFDPHPDHVATYHYGIEAARQTGAALFAYPVWALMLPANALMPALRPVGCTLRLGPLIERKRRAVMQHVSQIKALNSLGSAAFGLDDGQLDRMLTGTEAYIACNQTARRRIAALARPALQPAPP